MGEFKAPSNERQGAETGLDSNLFNTGTLHLQTRLVGLRYRRL